MRNQKTRNIKDLLAESSFGKILQKSTALQQLNQEFQQLLPNEIRPHCRVANFDGTTLAIDVKNAMVRQALLFHQQNLLHTLQQSYAEMQQIKLKVNPNFK